MWIAPPLLSVLIWNDAILPFLDFFIRKEIYATASAGLLFRGQNLTIKLLSLFAMHIGQQYLIEVLRPFLAELEAEERENGGLSFGFELDPQKLTSGDEAERQTNLTNLLRWTERLLCGIFDHADVIPMPLLHISAFLKQCVIKVHSDGIPFVLSGFFFLRFLCPVLVTPETLPGLNASAPTQSVRRLLVLIAKIVQNVATHLEFGEKEEYMCCCNPFISAMIPRITKFYEHISSRRHLRVACEITPTPVQRHHYHLIHVALSNYDLKGPLRKKKSVRKALEDTLEKLGKPERDERAVNLFGYVDLEKIVENLKNPATGILKYVLFLCVK